MRRQRLILLAVLTLAAVLVALLSPAISQDPAYHFFADQRTLLGIPNFWNVISNLPFIPLGIAGVIMVRAGGPGLLASQRLGCMIFFLGVALIGLGSGYYHLEPSNYSLVWDRLPMTLAFMAFVAVIVGENIDEGMGKMVLWPLLMIGLLSVDYWYYTELLGKGDLRLYALVQFLPMLLLPLILVLFRGPFNSNKWLWLAMLGYGASKIAEAADLPIQEAIGISGHSLKHLLAAAGALAFLLALKLRQPRQ